MDDVLKNACINPLNSFAMYLDNEKSTTINLCCRSAKLSDTDIKMYRERLKHEVEIFEKKLLRDRQRQEDKLHKKLTARKLKRIDEKVSGSISGHQKIIIIIIIIINIIIIIIVIVHVIIILSFLLIILSII